ncbi:MAG: TonB-dependent receptor domain-containing protein, partial [Bacteroidales bacterium]
TGNQGISAYQTQVYLATSNYPYGGSLSSGFSEVSWRGALNPDLKWETTDQYNAGVDMTILHSRINLTIDYYYKKTNDLLQQVSIPSSTGFTSQWTNSGWVTNEGWEFSAKVYAISKPNFKWDVDGNLSFNVNKIGGLDGDQFGPELWYGIDQFFIQRNGLPIGAMFGYVEDGLYDNEAEVMADPINASVTNPSALVSEIKYRDINGDGAITADDRTVIGDANPDYVFGLTNSFTYKKISLSFFLQGVMGNDIFNGNLTDVVMGNIGNIPVDAYNSRWVSGADNTDALWPKAIRSYNRNMLISDRYIEDGSYLRLKNINLGYRINPRWSGIDNIYVYGSATNLFTITNYSWFDPDVNAFAGDASRKGVDIYSYPSSMTFSIGFKVEF